MKYQLKDFNRNVPEGDLLADLKAVAGRLSKTSISSREYNDSDSKYTSGTIAARFGSWNNALQKAGLDLVHQREVSTEELFENLEQVWLRVGQQPTFRDMKKLNSKYSTHQYISKFGTWRNALVEFVEHINSDKPTDANEIGEIEQDIESIKNELPVFKHKAKRFPSERLKVQVLMRDGNKCRLCGITLTGDSIHFDHIKPWSKGGETILENLQILCDTHNLAKGNLDYEP
mgnify:CR=1 FL=1